MFARRLVRFAGLVFVLAVVFGGVGAVGLAGAAAGATTAFEASTLGLEWD